MEKKKSHAFGKDVYLLGTINGRYQWLEAPSWDCDWYWGFGYVEEYTRHDKPSASRDIVSHTHVDSLTTPQLAGLLGWPKGWEVLGQRIKLPLLI